MGRLTGHGRGPPAKQFLLELEGVRLKDGRVIDEQAQRSASRAGV